MLVLDRSHERFERRGLRLVVAAADQHAVTAGLDREDGRRRDRVLGGNRFHLEIVAEDDAVVLQLVAQQVGHHAARQRRGAFLVERRHQDVRGHDRRHAGLNRRLEWQEFHAAETVRRMLHDRQLEMGVGARVAVTGEMFAARRDALGLQRPHDGAAEPRSLLGLLRQRAIADDGILRVGVDVQDGRVVQRDADALQLHRERPGESFGQRHVAAPPERRHRRPLGKRRFQPRDAPAFLIDGDPHGEIRHQPCGIERQLGDLLGLGDVSREQDDAAQPELLRQRPKLSRNLLPVESGYQQLTNLTPQRAWRHHLRFYQRARLKAVRSRHGAAPRRLLATPQKPPRQQATSLNQLCAVSVPTRRSGDRGLV